MNDESQDLHTRWKKELPIIRAFENGCSLVVLYTESLYTQELLWASYNTLLFLHAP